MYVCVRVRVRLCVCCSHHLPWVCCGMPCCATGVLGSVGGGILLDKAARSTLRGAVGVAVMAACVSCTVGRGCGCWHLCIWLSGPTCAFHTFSSLHVKVMITHCVWLASMLVCTTQARICAGSCFSALVVLLPAFLATTTFPAFMTTFAVGELLMFLLQVCGGVCVCLKGWVCSS